MSLSTASEMSVDVPSSILKIPHASELTKRIQNKRQTDHLTIVNSQSDLITQAFQSIKDSDNMVRLVLDQPLVTELIQSLTDQGYSVRRKYT